MFLSELLSPERVLLQRGDAFDKKKALALLASLLSKGGGAPEGELIRVLEEREALQSTGVGEGVAIPHGALPNLEQQCAALLIVPDGIEFEAIDDAKVNILFAVVGPKRASGEHLKTLARVSRLLRNGNFRARLLSAKDSGSAFKLIADEEAQ
jgi:PTS system nitrogen regulatory IIA component